MGERGEVGSDEGVARIPALAERGEHESVSGRGRQILGRVHGQVGSSVEHGALHLLDEHALAADLVERDVETHVAGRLDGDQLDDATRGHSDRRRDGSGLSEGLS